MSVAQATAEKQRTRKFSPASPVRIVRLQAGITLQDAASEAGLTLHRASTLERYPERARGGELDRLRKSIETIAARRRTGGEPALPNP